MFIFLCAPYCICISIFYIWRLLWRTWRHGLKKKSLHSESLIQYLFWGQTISGNSKRILWSCCSILVFLISSLLYLYLYFYRICIFVWCREESKIVQAECNKRMPRLTPGSTFFNQPSTSTLCSVFCISRCYISPLHISTFFQPTILCWAQAHSLANCNLYSSIHVLHWNLSTTITTTTSLYFYTYSMVVYILAYMVPSFKVAYPSSWSHFSQTRSRPASYFSITTITASREKFESEVKYWAALITRSANMLMTGEMEVLLEDNRM